MGCRSEHRIWQLARERAQAGAPQDMARRCRPARPRGTARKDVRPRSALHACVSFHMHCVALESMLIVRQHVHLLEVCQMLLLWQSDLYPFACSAARRVESEMDLTHAVIVDASFKQHLAFVY